MSIKRINASKVMDDHFQEKLFDIELNDYRLRRKIGQVQEAMDKGFADISARLKELHDLVYGNTNEVGGL